MQLTDSLKKNRDSGIYPFHMPGHKRRLAGDALFEDVTGIDITEIRGFDDLHDPKGILREAEERAAAVFGADETHFLVNGSTCGILAAVCGTVTHGDNIIIAANCHRSVYNAVMLSGAKPYVITPENESYFEICGGIEAGAVFEALDTVRAERKEGSKTAVVITSPTYEGITSDVAAIAEICHEKGAVLIVDAAHGAHFGFSDDFPKSAAAEGADVVITSVHKTLPAMTQTALIHINAGCPSKDTIRKMLPVFMTSSPSYVLMASEDCLTALLDRSGTQLFEAYSKRLDDLYRKAEDFNNLSLLRKEKLTAKGSFDHDRGRIVVSDRTGKFSGRELYDILLDKYNICAEMAAGSYVVLITGIADTDEGFERLSDALSDIDRQADTPVRKSRNIAKRLYDRLIGKRAAFHLIKNMPHDTGLDKGFNKGYTVLGHENRMMAAMHEKDTEYIPVELAEGRTAAAYVSVYPPGIPVMIPGEVITAEAVDSILDAARNGLDIKGLKDKEVEVIWERSSI